MDRGTWWAIVHGGPKESDMTESHIHTNTHTHTHTHTQRPVNSIQHWVVCSGEQGGDALGKREFQASLSDSLELPEPRPYCLPETLHPAKLGL